MRQGIFHHFLIGFLKQVVSYSCDFRNETIMIFQNYPRLNRKTSMQTLCSW